MLSVKYLNVLLMSSLIITLVGCGSNGNQNSVNNSVPTILYGDITTDTNKTVAIGTTGTSIPIINNGGTITLSVQITTPDGHLTAANPPRVRFDSPDNMMTWGPSPMTPSATIKDQWDYTTRISGNGNINKLMIATVIAPYGNGLTNAVPVGVVYYKSIP